MRVELAQQALWLAPVIVQQAQRLPQRHAECSDDAVCCGQRLIGTSELPALQAVRVCAGPVR